MGYGPRGAIMAAAAANPGVTLILVLGENPDPGNADGSKVMLVGLVDASFGPRADLKGAWIVGSPCAGGAPRARPRCWALLRYRARARRVPAARAWGGTTAAE